LKFSTFFDNPNFADNVNFVVDHADEHITGTVVKKQCQIASSIVANCLVGDTILIFVPGVAEINGLRGNIYSATKGLVSQENRSNCEFHIIHSEFKEDKKKDKPQDKEKDQKEDQEAVEARSALERFLTERRNEVKKIIIATNAAESAITIPDLNVVIDLGTNNVEVHDSSNYSRTMLQTKWISKASAKQRAGRTGRTCDGVVYRLFPKSIYDRMKDRTPPAVQQKPLHDAVIRMLGLLHNEVYFSNRTSIADIFDDLVEPPDRRRLQDDLAYLHRNHLIMNRPVTSSNAAPERNDNNNEIDEHGVMLTVVGKFASEMPLSSHLSRLIFYSIILEIPEYGVIVASILSFNTRPFRNPLLTYKTAGEYNHTTRKVFLSNVDIDRQEYCEPLMLLKLYILWTMNYRDKDKKIAFCNRYNLDQGKMVKFSDSINNVRTKVNDFCKEYNLGISEIKTLGLPIQVDRETVNLIRYLLLWTSDGNIIRRSSLQAKERKIGDPSSLYGSYENKMLLHQKSRVLTEEKLKELFPTQLEAGFEGKHIVDGAEFNVVQVQRELHVVDLTEFPSLGGIVQFMNCLLSNKDTNSYKTRVQCKKFTVKGETEISRPQAAAVWSWFTLNGGHNHSEQKVKNIFIITSREKQSLERFQNHLRREFRHHYDDDEEELEAPTITCENGFHSLTIEDPSSAGIYMMRKLVLLFPVAVELFASSSDRTIRFRKFNWEHLSEAWIRAALQLCFDQVNVAAWNRFTLEDYRIIEFGEPYTDRSPYHNNCNSSFKDLPLGQRLLNAYCRSRPLRQLVVEPVETMTNLHGIYCSWELLQSSTSVLEKESAAVSPTMKPLTNQKTTAFRSQVWRNANIDRFSFLQSSIPELKQNQESTNETPVYGIANSVIISAGKGKNQENGERTEDFVRCDMITFIPYSEKWLLNGLAAVSDQWFNVYAEQSPDGNLSEVTKLYVEIRRITCLDPQIAGNMQVAFQVTHFRDKVLRLNSLAADKTGYNTRNNTSRNNYNSGSNGYWRNETTTGEKNRDNDLFHRNDSHYSGRKYNYPVKNNSNDPIQRENQQQRDNSYPNSNHIHHRNENTYPEANDDNNRRGHSVNSHHTKLSSEDTTVNYRWERGYTDINNNSNQNRNQPLTNYNSRRTMINNSNEPIRQDNYGQTDCYYSGRTRTESNSVGRNINRSRTGDNYQRTSNNNSERNNVNGPICRDYTQPTEEFSSERNNRNRSGRTGYLERNSNGDRNREYNNLTGPRDSQERL
jgi:hypothetical protein